MTHTLRKHVHYSDANIAKILEQFPEATEVRGYRDWQKVGRQVRRGETGIAILAPIKPKKDENKQPGEISSKELEFRCRKVYVFDVSQTETAAPQT